MATEHFCLRWNNHQSTLISVFDNLLERESLVDCTLAADGRYLKAHKVVLSACSPFLGMLLTQHYDKHPIIILKDVKFDELKAMLDYMYRGEVNISQEQLSAFLKAAESLQIKGLTDSGAEELNSLHSNRPPSSNSTTSVTNEDPQSPAAYTEGESPSSRKRKIDKDDLIDGEVSSKHSASDSSIVDGRSVPSVSDSPSTAKQLNLTRIKTEPFVEVSEQMSTSSVDESSESAMFSRPGPSNECGPSNKGSSWSPSMDQSWDGVQGTPTQDNTSENGQSDKVEEVQDNVREITVNSKEPCVVVTEITKQRPNPYQPGDWVVVRYDDLLYPGEVISLPSNGIEINAMEPTTCGSYKWPTRRDVHTYLLEDVVKRIEPPIPCGSRASQFIFKDSF